MEKDIVESIFLDSKLDIQESVVDLSTRLQQQLEAGFKDENITQYCKDLSVLENLLSYLHRKTLQSKPTPFLSEEEADTFYSNSLKIVDNILDTVGFPLLSNIHPSESSQKESLKLLASGSQLITTCCLFHPLVLVRVLDLVVKNLDSFLTNKGSNPADLDDGNTANLDIYTVIEVLRHALGKETKDILDDYLVETLDLIFKRIIDSLQLVSTEIGGSLCVPVLVKILSLDKNSTSGANLTTHMDMLWKSIQKFAETDPTDGRMQYILLCGFANYFFPVSTVSTEVDLRKETKFWEILQAGLLSKDSLNRKRSLYLVKRVVDLCETMGRDVSSAGGVIGPFGGTGVSEGGIEVPMFWWSKKRSTELSKIWQDFMLLAEVFEDKQVHVIKPLLPRMKTLIKASTIPATQEMALLHSSWLTTLFLRCSFHESINICRWSAETVLSIDLGQCPMLQQEQHKFLTGSLLYSLQEAKLFNRDNGVEVGTLPVVAGRLEYFFISCWKTLTHKHRGPFFCEIVENICNRHWGPVPLLFICRGLAQVPASPCLGRDTVLNIRKLFSGFISTMENYVRGGIQGYIVQFMLRLTDKSTVTVEEFMQILSLVSQEHCLQRGTTLWTQCKEFFKQEVDSSLPYWKAEEICDFVTNSVTKYLETTIDSKYSSADEAPAQMVARLLVLVSDAAIATKMDDNNKNTLITVTEKLVEIVNSINTHAYMSTHKADKVLQLLHVIMDEFNPQHTALTKDDQVEKVIFTGISDCSTEMISYISRQISDSFAIVTYSDLALMLLYVDNVKMLLHVAHMMKDLRFDKLVDSCIGVLTWLQTTQTPSYHTQMQQVSAMCLLGTVADHISTTDHNTGHIGVLQDKICDFLKSWKIATCFQRPQSDDYCVSQQEWGKIASFYLTHQWQVIQMALQSSTAPWWDMQTLLMASVDTLNVGLEETTIPVMGTLQCLLPKSELGDPDLVYYLDTCWSCVMEVRRAGLFWPVLEAFVSVTYQSYFLTMSEDSLVVQALKKYAGLLLEQGQDKSGVVNVLARRLCAVLGEPGMLQHADNYIHLIVDLCKFGRLLQRGERHDYDVSASLKAQGDQCPVNDVKEELTNPDILVRTTIVSLLCKLNPSDATHCCLATSIMKRCIHVYEEVIQGSSNRFANSGVHRCRHRLIQAVLLLQPLITEEFSLELWEWVWSSLEQECQPSIRHMLEWLAMSAIYKHQQLGDKLWLLFEKYRETKNMVLCSLLCIVIHIGTHITPDKQVSFYEHAIPSILPWCMAHHFNTRIFAQATLCKLWEQCTEQGHTHITKANAVLQSIVNFNQDNRNSTKNVKKLLDSFFFKFLDFRRDYSLETIFHSLPTLTNLSEEDWITPEMFIKVNPAWKTENQSFISLYNQSDYLSSCDPGKWKFKGGLRGPDDDLETGDGCDGDVQKKIMPWKQMMPDDDVTEEIEHGVKQRDEDGLVVVTSLIKKLPNLGGLCRTSEIFGVSEYVLGKLHDVEDKSFQGLSVTAHKWIPITEVHKSKLPEYLVQKRLEGYTLVGVEQTANSVKLTDYAFPVKSLLLLGNEKEGIPVDLISLLDVCVEIPQQGVIRSLNVHVSGALLIWEYRRQQLVNMKPSN